MATWLSKKFSKSTYDFKIVFEIVTMEVEFVFVI